MTEFNNANIISNYKAGADLSADSNLYKAVKFDDSSGDIIAAVAGDKAVGFLFNLPDDGETAEIATIGGGALAIAAASISAGDLLKSDANGKMVVASNNNDMVIARAMSNAASGDIFSVQPCLFSLGV